MLRARANLRCCLQLWQTQSGGSPFGRALMFRPPTTRWHGTQQRWRAKSRMGRCLVSTTPSARPARVPALSTLSSPVLLETAPSLPLPRAPLGFPRSLLVPPPSFSKTRRLYPFRAPRSGSRALYSFLPFLHSKTRHLYPFRTPCSGLSVLGCCDEGHGEKEARRVVDVGGGGGGVVEGGCVVVGDENAGLRIRV